MLGATVLATERKLSIRWPGAVICGFLMVVSSAAWLAGGAPNPLARSTPPEPLIQDILEAAALEGTYAYDPVSEAANMPPREMLEGPYVMVTTARHRQAKPQTLLLAPTSGECVRFARVIAELHGHLAFCEQAF
ncbi:hypothetical protein FHG66_17750 [Rubellimicrobium rubrum]|uniref:Uncharacterized protein n=1 Tax=Rubellimicrobium rubrum TaxID=2585369 RepID=A0A5C4MMY3_9RHOB|nr:hypothetical protein [Rubellimicrobium rubrum]TNC46936.1 hypothetical protein FHG66_17750 [Rubellimicrobium rubrum]